MSAFNSSLLAGASAQDASLDAFHPAVRAWFARRFDAPTDAQRDGWPAIRSGRDALLAAPTGSGKTLAAFLAGIDMLIRKGERGDLQEALEILYVSPLKALGADIYRNLEAPLREIREVATEMGYDLPEIRIAVRSGDSTASERQAITRRPPHILITTPESLYLMLTAEKSRPTLRTVHTVIVDEIHALLRDRRGSHLGLSLARLDHVADQRPARIGLSATQRPIEEVAAYLVGTGPAPHDRDDKHPSCVIVDRGHQRAIDISIETPPSELEAVASAEQWGEVYGRLAELVEEHHTTLIFVNTRRLAERVAHHLSERLGPEHVASHHGSLSKERRLQLEQRLKAGEMRALVATASLELGIDIGSIDLVCQVGSPRSISTFLQRVGRSGHALGLTPCGKLFPTTRDELVECAALIRAVRAGRLDRIVQPKSALDVLAQQIVAECACEDWSEDDLYDLVRNATQYQHLARTDFDDVVEMLSEGIGDIAGRAAPLLHRDRIGGVVRGRRGARLKALTNGGTIPETGDYRVVAEPDEMTVGSVNEDFAIESMAGDIFLLGTTSWRIKRIEAGVVRVENAHGAPPTIPFWLGEAPGRTLELSQEVGALRRDIVDAIPHADALRRLLHDECGLSEQGAGQIADYVQATRDSLGVIPSDTDVVFERFFDEAGDQHLVVHAPFGARINRAWGLTLRKRFCVRFDFELQAAASDDAIVLSIGPAQSFPLEESFDYVKADNARAALEQAILYVPLFGTRWRWNATRALAVDRWRSGKKVPPQIQRMRSDDLLAAVFPAQVGCQENISGPIDFPEHPLIKQTLDDCLNEAMDLDSLTAVLRRIEAGEITLHARDTTEPSPMAHEIINSKPFTFLDDAPLEERRTRAVQLRHALPRDARDLAALDPDAIQRVREEAWPDPRNAEEVHDALLTLVAIESSYVTPWATWLDELVDAGRAATAVLSTDNGATHDAGSRHWFAAEHLPLIERLYPSVTIEPQIVLPNSAATPVTDRDDARGRLARGHAESFGPLTASILARTSGLALDDADRALRQIESLGDVLRGHFTTTDESGPPEFCDRRLLARIHRYTLDRLRQEIDPVGAQDYMRFLLQWHHLTPGTRLRGKQGLREAIRLLQGFEAPAMTWERDLLPARVAEYDPAWLDDLCLGGEVTWARLSARSPRTGKPATGAATPSRVMPVTIAPRTAMAALRDAVRGIPDSDPSAAESFDPTSGAGREILTLLRDRGALFFDEIVDQTHRLADDVERGLRDLVARGLAHADGFEGLRQLAGRRAPRRRRRRSAYGPGGMFTGSGPAGRWAPIAATPSATTDDALARDDLAERIANTLLLRYGVIFRDLMERERFTLPWRDILRALRRMEARGAVRGGRFVSGFVGEQYALPQAVAALRATRRKTRTGEQVYLSAVDPCNLVGIVLPGAKIVARADGAVLLVDGAEPADEATPGVPWPNDEPAQPIPTTSR